MRLLEDKGADSVNGIKIKIAHDTKSGRKSSAERAPAITEFSMFHKWHGPRIRASESAGDRVSKSAGRPWERPKAPHLCGFPSHSIHDLSSLQHQGLDNPTPHQNSHSKRR